MLRWAVAGSVDDGKSTLIGRLMLDQNLLFQDQLQAIAAQSETGQVDLAWITDGLRAERQQGITIDVAYRFFTLNGRKFILIDTPGHEQFTKNMFTGVSQAQVVVILVDAQRGITQQTKRHALLCSLLQVPEIILVVNKMDCVGFAQNRFEEIRQQFLSFCRDLHPTILVSIPCSALEGDNVVHTSSKMAWYSGPSLLQHLASIEPSHNQSGTDFRLVVQGIIKFEGFRGYTGSVLSGKIRPHQPVQVWPSGRAARIERIITMDQELGSAHPGQAVVLTVDQQLEVDRGYLWTKPNNPPLLVENLDTLVFWMSEQPLKTDSAGQPQRYRLLHNGIYTHLKSYKIQFRIDEDQLTQVACDTVNCNQVARVQLNLCQAVACDPYHKCKSTGRALLIDEVSNETVAACLVRGPGALAEWQKPLVYPHGSTMSSLERRELFGHKAQVLWFTGRPGSGKSSLCAALELKLQKLGCRTFWLDGDTLRADLNMDLDFSNAGRSENLRRAGALAKIAFDQGQIVLCSFVSPIRSDREGLRARFPQDSFWEIYLECDIETLRLRDSKGLLSQAEKGKIKDFTGVTGDYQAPICPELHFDTGVCGIEECAGSIIERLRRQQIVDVNWPN